MALKFISREEVKRVLTYASLIPQMECALQFFAERKVDQPVRTVVNVKPANGFLGVMPAYSATHNALAAKLVTFYPNNTDVPTHNAIIVMFDVKTGIPDLLMDGEYITTMRTAAVSAVATKYLGKKDPKILAILGTGVQARSHFKALSSLFKFSKVKVWSRSQSNVKALATEIDAVGCETAQSAVCDADVIVTVTSSDIPVLNKEWVKKGAHINAVGACRPDWQEVDPELMNSATVYVDSREAALKESGDIILSKAEIYAELGEVIGGKKEANVDQTTIFKSLGLAIEDVISAKLVRDLLSEEQKSV